MKCPMLTMYAATYTEPDKYKDRDCLKEECAWWDEDSSACAIWSIMSGLDALGKLFREIEKKMPHELQF